MKFDWKRQRQIWMGALSALIVGWSAIAFGIWLTSVAIGYLRPPPSFLLPPTEYILGFGALWLAAVFPIGFAMGLICSFFWQSVEPTEYQQQWATGLSIVFFLPVAILGCGALCVLLFAFPLLLFALRRGIAGRAKLPHFFGLTNDWERDDKS